MDSLFNSVELNHAEYYDDIGYGDVELYSANAYEDVAADLKFRSIKLDSALPSHRTSDIFASPYDVAPPLNAFEKNLNLQHVKVNYVVPEKNICTQLNCPSVPCCVPHTNFKVCSTDFGSVRKSVHEFLSHQGDFDFCFFENDQMVIDIQHTPFILEKNN